MISFITRIATDVDLNSVLTPGAVEDHFRIKKVVGNGRFGEVHKAVHKITGRKCALKFVSKAEVSAPHFIQEAKLMRRLGRHPNITEFLGVYVTRDGSRYVLASEYASGGPLSNFVFGMDLWRPFTEAEVRAAAYLGLGTLDLSIFMYPGNFFEHLCRHTLNTDE